MTQRTREIGIRRGFGAAFETMPQADVSLLLWIAAALALTAAAALVVPATRAARLPLVQALRE